ncbi:MAG TPA: hypothetical protein VGP55_02405 [Chitinophagaceae bacterium]|nr:hypothetical protein [Chitinophagaceae bacterium]
MLTIISAAIIVSSVILIFKGLIFLHNREEKKTSAALNAYYNEVATKHSLTVLNPEIIKDAILGLNEICDKLLVVKSVETGKYKWHIIDLYNVKSCTVIKDCKSSYSNNPKEKTTERFVDQIYLQFEFIDEEENVEINFYTHILNHISDMPQSEQKARKWEEVISKIIKKKLKRIA